MISDGRTVDDIEADGEEVRSREARRTRWRPIVATAAFFAMTVFASAANDADTSTRVYVVVSAGIIALLFWATHTLRADLAAAESMYADAVSYLDEPEDDEPEA